MAKDVKGKSGAQAVAVADKEKEGARHAASAKAVIVAPTTAVTTVPKNPVTIMGNATGTSGKIITLTFPDGTKKEFPAGITGYDVAASIGQRLAMAALAVTLDGKLLDTFVPLLGSGTFSVITFNSPEGKEVFRHTTAHLFAYAIQELYPGALNTIGPAVEEGFYYDFDNLPITPDDFGAIEAKMAEIAKRDEKVERVELTLAEAQKLFATNPYKLEMIDEFATAGDKLSAYRIGKFVDLCRGPHLPRLSMIRSFKLTKIAGAYWRGDAKNKQLTRVYGISFPEKKELEAHLKLIEEAERRDHRKIGRELKLFSVHDEGPGFPFFHPKGMMVWNELLDFWRVEHRKAGYVEIKTPIMLSKALWETSGHWVNYRQNMYTLTIDEQEFAVKPMNCPGGLLWYAEEQHSYKEFPLRVGEIGLVHRHELSGALSGLFRVRCFHQDDAHIFMTEDHIKDEILGVLNLADRFYKVFGLDYHLELSTRPAKSIGTDAQWEKAETAIKGALDSSGKTYKLNPGDGAFYGPKIDIHIKDCIGRTWQCGTIQLDMNLPERFNISYIGDDNQKHRPVMIHRVIYGSMERFFGILIEHYAGKFPLWLSPEQCRVVTISEKSDVWANDVYRQLVDAGVRCTLDTRPDTINKKIREAELDKVNYVIVVGEKEAAARAVNVRARDEILTADANKGKGQGDKQGKTETPAGKDAKNAVANQGKDTKNAAAQSTGPQKTQSVMSVEALLSRLKDEIGRKV